MDDNRLKPEEGKPVEIFIDGQSMTAPEGGNLLQFMIGQEIDIPYFCYHPGLSVVAVCRQCLVELEGMPKLVPACQTPIREGMKVLNSSDRAKDARRQLLEFTLVNHPVDCPIFDKAGECVLQQQYMDYNTEESRADIGKVHKDKAVSVGPRIMLDKERCILCSRCARFMAQVAGQPQLVISQRGNHSEISVAPGTEFDSNYSLNTVDICPVGALTDKDFRFKSRVWELSKSDSVCNGCATGCKCEVHHKNGDVYRLVPRRFKDIDLNWMCDFGRYTYKAVADSRLTLPKTSGKDAGWDEALDKVGSALQKLVEAGDGGKVGVVLGADATNEDNFVLASLARNFMETDHLYLAAEADGEGDDFLRHADPNPNRAGATACGGEGLKSAADLEKDLKAGKLKALYVLGDKLDMSGEALARAASLQLFAVQATHPGPAADKAQVVLPAAMWAEVDGTLTNAEGKVQRMYAAVQPPDFARPHLEILLGVAQKANLTLRFTSAKAVFEVMQKEITAFADAEWGKPQVPVLLRYANSRG